MKGSPAGEHRAGHGALMDSVYRRQRYIYDFTRKYYLLGRDHMLGQVRLGPDTRVIEIGCGTARNLILLGRKNPAASLYGVDASEAMLQTASQSVARSGLQVFLARGFAEHVSPGLFGLREKFDAAIFSYSLSMIPDWRGALLASANAVKDEGAIHIVDFGDLKSLWGPFARGLRAWLRWFHVSPRDELLSVLERASRSGGCSLQILPFRYAFILKASPAAIRAILAC